jgi:hypothetical protein
MTFRVAAAFIRIAGGFLLPGFQCRGNIWHDFNWKLSDHGIIGRF